MDSLISELLNKVNLFDGALLSILALIVQFIVQLYKKIKLERELKLLASQFKKNTIDKADKYSHLHNTLIDYYREVDPDNSSVSRNLRSLFTIIYDTSVILLAIEGLTDASKRKSNTIVGMMIKERATAANKSHLLLLGTLVVYLIISSTSLINFNWLAVIFPSVLLLALHADQYLVAYRIRKGWYGRNEYEAREIIDFILSHAEKDDFNDEGGLKKLMDAPENTSHQQSTNEDWVKA